MELWIRSQDKEVLTRVVDIWKDADKNEIWSKSSFATKNCLGIYETKERALEVLNEIQDELSYPEWKEQECIVRSVKECKELYGLGIDCEYRIISIEEVK